MKITNDFIFFWGKEDIFSQWNHHGFDYEGIHFKTAEHWMMFQKAVFFEYKNKTVEEIKDIIARAQAKAQETGIPSRNILAKILNASTPKEAKDLGKEVRYFNKQKWEAIVAKVLFKGNKLKFEQNPALYTEMMKHKTQRFVEASPFDSIYGIGLRDSHPDANDPARWRGQNILGDVLTELRNYFLKIEQGEAHVI